MSQYAWNIGFAISLAISISFSLVIGRKVFKTGIEHFSSRILIFSSIVDTALCSLLFLCQGINELCRILTSTSFSLGQVVVPIIFLVVPCKIVWNYFASQKKVIVRNNLQPHDGDPLAATISSLSRTMNISIPTVLSSETVSMPFVFGLRSSKAILAVPKSWQTVDSDQDKILLLHELGHIRNHDVGFLAWSNACIQDLRLLLAILPALVVYCYAFGFEIIAPSIYTYLACSFILYILLRYVVRKRELLADMTAAMLIESGKVCEVISELKDPAMYPRIDPDLSANPRLADKVYRYLSDKALFSQKQQTFWKLLLKVFSFVQLFHPAKTERANAIHSASDLSQKSDSSLSESFWVGVTLGLWGVIIAVGGYWFALYIQMPDEELGIVRLPYLIYGMTSPIPLGVLPLFLALPAWSSFKQPILSTRFLLSLLARYGMSLAGACLIAPLILTAGIIAFEIRMILVLCILWFVFIIVFGFGINIAVVFGWITIRYFQSNQIAELKRVLGSFCVFIVTIFGLIIVGGILFNQAYFPHILNGTLSDLSNL